MKQLRAQLANRSLTGFFTLGLGTMAALAIGFFTQAYIARVLDVEGYGSYSFYRVIVGYLSLVSNLGLDTYLLRSVAANKLSAEQALASQLYFRVPFSSLVTLSFTLYITFSQNPQAPAIITLSLLAILLSLNLDWLLQVRQRFQLIALLQLGSSAFTFVLVLLLVRDRDDFLAYSIALVIVEALKAIVYWRAKGTTPASRRQLPPLGRLLRSGLLISGAGILIQIYYNMDRLFLGLYRSLEEVGLYSAAYNILMVALVPIGLLVKVSSPRLATHPNSWPHLRSFALRAVGLAFLVFIPLILLHRFVINILFGEAYGAAASILLILSFNVLASYGAGAFALPLTLWGYDRAYFVIVALGAITNIAGNWLFVPHYGMTAAALITIVSEIVVMTASVLYLLVLFRRREGL